MFVTVLVWAALLIARWKMSNTPPHGSTPADRDFSVLLRLYDAANERRSERRSYEWKVSAGLWGGLLLLMRIASDARATLSPTQARSFPLLWWLVVGGLGAVIVVGHWFWMFKYANEQHDFDLKRATEYEEKLRRAVGYTTPLSYPSSKSARTFQVVVTAVLVVPTSYIVGRVLIYPALLATGSAS